MARKRKGRKTTAKRRTARRASPVIHIHTNKPKRKARRKKRRNPAASALVANPSRVTYITVPPKKRKKRERKLTRYASTSRYLVGLDVHYSPAPSPRGDGDHTLMRRHEVRGHWKWQACGVRRTERRHIWVRPYMRGTDLAGRIHKTYADKPEEALPEEET